MKRIVIIGWMCASFMASISAFGQKSPAPVHVEQGWLQGVLGTDSSVIAYKGVPFAEPPSGDLRWREPQPPSAWEGVRKADQYGANCTQVMTESYGPWTSEYQPQGSACEDCLYLNIWTQASLSDEKRPVMVYIPGGAFTGGSGNVPVYNGENLAKKGLVIVTINYRVGIMGFFAHPELTKESPHNSSGNYGLLDQVAALQWVKQNISAFGGDPDRVTVMGQSAGAMSVLYLTASPLAKGLFNRAIVQSGFFASLGPREDLASAEGKGVKFSNAKGASSLATLRAMTAEELTAQTETPFRFNPIVDGWLIPKSVDAIYSNGQQNDLTTLVGWVADEGSSSDRYGKASVEDFRNQVIQQAGELADKVLALYPCATEQECAESQKALARDMSLVSMYLWGMKRAETGKTGLYTYLFTHQQPGATREKYLAFHSSELPYVFDNLNQSPRPWTAEDEKIAGIMSMYWTNFITTGDPNGKGLSKWPMFSESPEETMELGDMMASRSITSRERFDVLKQLMSQVNP